jgi:Anti-sigma regulatory factor (Ser/Thr protein kinase)
MDSKLKISLINNISEVSRLVEQVEIFAEENEISFKILNTINLALDEIITNIISYGYSDEIQHIIEVELLKDNVWLTVTIIDDAKEFNPLEQPEPDVTKSLEEKQIGGLGIHLIRNLLDELDYRRVENKNIFVMRKKINSD